MQNGVFSFAMRLIMLLLITNNLNLVLCLRLSQSGGNEQPLYDNSQDNLLSSATPELLSVDQADLDVFSEVLASGESMSSLKQEADDSQKAKPLGDEQSMEVYLENQETKFN